MPTDVIFFDLVLIKPTPAFVEIYGNVRALSVGDSPETAHETAAVAFTDPSSYLRLARWKTGLSAASIELHFKTVEPDGLLVCSIDGSA